jgi:hypothetical protein
MSVDRYEDVKKSVLDHIQSLFKEMEEDMATSHQEKYALLEDAFENASDEDELKVAFEQWYAEHAEDLGLDYDVDELWEQALGGEVNYDSYKADEESELLADDGQSENTDNRENYKDDYGDKDDNY